MVASMIGIGPHEMTAWLWVFSLGLTVLLAALAGLVVYVVAQATGRPQRTARRGRT